MKLPTTSLIIAIDSQHILAISSSHGSASFLVKKKKLSFQTWLELGVVTFHCLVLRALGKQAGKGHIGG